MVTLDGFNRKDQSKTKQFEDFNILDHRHKLEKAKDKDRYICPNCGGNDLTIRPKDGAYKCWHGCECSDIREAVSPWKDMAGNDNSSSPNKSHALNKKSLNRPIPYLKVKYR